MTGRTVIAPALAAFWRRISSLRHLLALSPRQADFSVRGFAHSDPSRRLALEAVGKAFIGGYNAALLADSVADVLHYVEQVHPGLRGFAAEGGAMGTAIVDALPFRRERLPEIVASFESDLTYLVHVGAGWALARVPWRRCRILAPLDPVHRWLAFDGLGFHDCYFHHERALAGWRRERSGYAARCYDQGVGRALWFVCGGSIPLALETVIKLGTERANDLWSGLGLAMAYAGSADETDFAWALGSAGPERASFAQGIAFACEARARAGHLPTHTRLAAQALGYEAESLAALVHRIRAELPQAAPDEPRYEAWRRSVADAMRHGSQGMQ
jgi:hypothetical protein